MDALATIQIPPAAGQAAVKPVRRLSPFRFTIGPGLFREQTTLYRTLDAALLAEGEYDKIGLVPSGHLPWRPFFGKTETSPLRPELSWNPWQVLHVYHYKEAGMEDSIRYIAAFSKASDAFDFAEMKTKQERARWSKQPSSVEFFVCLWAQTEDGRKPEIARLAPDHLAKLRRQQERERRRKERAA